jgi:hypothetical protein
MKNEKLVYLESLRSQELIIPSELSRTDMIPLDRIRQKKFHKLYQFEVIYLSEHLRKMKENFIRKYYPRNKLKRQMISHEKLSSEAIKFICDEMIQRGQDHKALMLASDIRDKEVFGQVCGMFSTYGLKKLVKTIQNVVQERESNSLYGGLSSRRGDTLDYFYDGKTNPSHNPNSSQKPNLQKKRTNNRFTNFVEQPNQGFKNLYQEIEDRLNDEEIVEEKKIKDEKDEEKENEIDVSYQSKKRTIPDMNSLMDNLYKKSLDSKPIKKVHM